MSHYNKIKTRLKNKDSLVAALKALGFDNNKLKIHSTAQHLEGFQGDKRKETAEIVIPRKYVGGAANDIGFKKQKDGTYEAIISDYDKTRYGTEWQGKLQKRYSIEQTKKAFTNNGWTWQEKKDSKGRLQLVGTRY